MNGKTVSKKEINEYIKCYKKGEPAKSIARRYNRDISTITYYLKKNNIKIRSVKEAMYIGELKGYFKSNRHIIPTSSKNLTISKAYIIGVLCGDGWLWYDPGECYQIGLGVTDKEFRDYFRECLQIVYKIPCSLETAREKKRNRKLQYITRLCSKEACDDMKNIGGEFKTAVWRVPDIIKKANLKIQAKFIQGFADSEGGIDSGKRRINLTSTNLEGLKEMQELTNNLKIRSVIQKSERDKNRKDCYNLRIQDRESMILFHQHIGFKIKRKQKYLEECLNSYNLWTIPHKESAKLIPKMKELRAQGLTYEEIGKKLGIGMVTAWVNTNKKA